MHKKKRLSCLVAGVLLMATVATPAPVRAAGVVGTGTPASCTEAAFVAALSGGGAISFNCGAAPVTITLTAQRAISANTNIDGGGLITFQGNASAFFAFYLATPGVSLSFNRITARNFAGTFVYAANGSVFIGNSMFQSNQRTLLNIQPNSAATVSASTFISNSMNGYGGVIANAGILTVTMSSFVGNSASISYEGGAIYNQTVGGQVGVINISKTTFDGNTGGYGGAISNYGIITITQSTLSNNRSTFNGGGGGGAINSGGFGTSQALTIINTTFSGNSSLSNSKGGAIYANNRGLSLTNVTLVNNTSGTGSSLYLLNGANATLLNTIVSGGICAKGGTELFTDSGGNLAFNAAGCPGTSADPQLTALQDNGGQTLTHAFTNGVSPAINGGTNTGCPAYDQRGVLRPQSGLCDSGAVEREAVPFFDTLMPDKVCGGAGSLLITAAGTNFIDGPSGTRFKLGGVALATVFVNPTQLQATIGAADLALPPHALQFTLETPVGDGGVSGAARTIQVENCTINPVAGLTATSNSPTNLGGATQFTATISSGTNVTYVWDFGDGQTGSGPNPTHTYANVGSYIAVVTATNSAGSLMADTVVNVNLSTTGVLVGDLSSKYGALITYTYIVTHVAPAGSLPVSVIISGNVPANTVLVSSPNLDAVATGGDYGNGYVQTPQPVTLQAGQSATIVWTVRPIVYVGDIVNQAHSSTNDGRLQLFQRNRVRRSLAPLIYR